MNKDSRYRSHHDSEQALRVALNLPRRPVVPEAPDLTTLLESEPRNPLRGVYLHVPYCDRFCAFCNMNRKPMREKLLAEYSLELTSQIDNAGKSRFVRGRPFETVYFGGGTPTVLTDRQFEALLFAVREAIPMSRDYEWTIETTIHNATDEKLELMRRAGVNRVSIGVQTFSDSGRKLLGRTGTGEYVRRRLKAMRKRFEGTIGIDVIYSYPDQTIEEIDEDARAIQELDVDSVSFYSLILHDGSTMHDRINSGALRFSRSVEDDRRLHQRLLENLFAQDFELLELTKLVRPGRDDYRYIRHRYAGGDLLPIGNGAGGLVADHTVYRMSCDRILISPVDRAFERYHRVLGLLQFGRYDAAALSGLCGAESEEHIIALLSSYERDGYLNRAAENSWELTEEGIFWGNNLAVDFLEHAVRNDSRRETA